MEMKISQIEAEKILETLDFKVILLKEGDWWVAHLDKYDVAAQGRTMKEAVESVRFSLICYIMIDGGAELLASTPDPVWNRITRKTE